MTSAENLEQKLHELELFSKRTDDFSGVEVTSWVIECHSFFSAISVDNKIIKDFMSAMDLNTMEIARGEFGALVPSDRQFKWHSVPARKYDIAIAFGVASLKIKSIKEDKNLVPQWLLDSLSGNENLAGVFTQLNSIETGHEKKSPELLMTSANTLLDMLLDFNDILKTKRRLGPKLQSLIENEEYREFFGASRDMVISLNNSRVIRNDGIVHPSTDLKNNIPLLVAISYAYLVVFFLTIFLATGNLETKNDS